MTIYITEEHIDQGLQKSCRFCAVALALAEQVRPSPMVGAASLSWYGDDVIYGLPPVAQSFIKLFDEDKSLVSPFSFEIRNLSPL